MGQSAQTEFNPRLESLRGLAALAVLITHCCGAFVVGGHRAYWAVPFLEQATSAKALTVLNGLLSAGGAVVLFFVLSGYVLTLSLLRSRQPLGRQVGPYIVKRAFRLLPAMWVSILAILAVRYSLSEKAPHLFLSDWYEVIFGTPITGSAIAKNFILMDFQLNPITWTMYVEAICSLLLPILVFITLRGKLIGLGLLSTLIIVAFGSSEGAARRYLFCFQIGVLLACYPELIRRARHSVALFLIGIVVLSIQRVLMIGGVKGTVLEAIAGAMILVAVLTARSAATFQWLELAPIRFFGRVSYSIYLLHLTALYIVAQVLVISGALKLGGILPQLVLAVGTVCLTAPIAWASYTAIELPAIRYGKVVANSLAAMLQMRHRRAVDRIVLLTERTDVVLGQPERLDQFVK